MKTKNSKPDSKPPVFSLTRWRKLYVSAVEAHPEDFTEAEPSGNMSRIFVVLLLVHVFLIGSVVIYNIVAERPRIENAVATAPPAKPKAQPSKPASPKPLDSAKTATVAPLAVAVPATVLRVYEVGSGDSIPSIAAKFGVDPDKLLTLNRLDDGGELYPGRKLNIPEKAQVKKPEQIRVAPPAPPVVAVAATPPVAAKPTPAPAASKPDDSVPKATLVKAPTVNEKIQDAPPKAEKKTEKSAVASAPPAPKPAEAKQIEKPVAKPVVEKKMASTQTYTTTAKDTFYSVAKKFKVKVDDVMRLNGMSDPSKLRAGMKLKIPAKD